MPNENIINMTTSPPITAEWTVRAHLTLTRPDQNYRNISQSACNGSTNGCNSSANTNKNCASDGNPIKVAYKWCSLGDNVNVNANDEPSTVHENHFRNNNSFRSNENIPPSDSGISCAAASTENSQINFKPKGHSHSTCNIILSACMDFGAKPCNIVNKFTDFKVKVIAYNFIASK